MSSNIAWQPIKENWHFLCKELKFAMQKRYDGRIDGILNHSDIAYLEGLRDAGIKDADKLISAIEKYNEIQITEIF
jgi:hypothetical protein